MLQHRLSDLQEVISSMNCLLDFEWGMYGVSHYILGSQDSERW